MGLYNADGLIRIKEDDTKTGAYTADGAWRVDDRADGPFVTRTGARRKDMTQARYQTVDETAGGGDPDPTAPAAFVLADWDLDPGIELATVTINSLPDDGGEAITDVEYRVDAGSWTSSGGVVSFDITGLTGGVEVDVELRAINSVGAGDASDVKSVTPTAAEYTFTNSEAEDIVLAMTTEPDDTRKALIDDTVGALKTAGIWAKLDRLWVLAAHETPAARLNWKTAVTDLAAVNSPTFTVDEGYASDGSTSYLNTGANPATTGVQFTQNSACVFLGVFDDYVGAAARGFGCFDGTNSLFIEPRRAADTIRCAINSTSTLSSGVIASAAGLKSANRSSSSAAQLYNDGAVAAQNPALSSTAIPSRDLYILAWNSNGAPGLFLPAGISVYVAGFGASLDATEQATLNTIFDDYLAGL